MSDQLIIRETVPSDAKLLLEFLKRAGKQSDFIEYEDIENVSVSDEADSLSVISESDFDEIFVAVFDGSIVGFCRLEKVSEVESEYGVVVEKDFWNNNIASYLTEEAIDWARHSPIEKISLEVYKNNPVAIHLYEKFGFTTELEKDKTLIMKRMA
ncbi:GNAT family N-acetyltransferase [Companilactobacillus keshanensis]|uniref:GNAT family N-acetyltransferase n=1 Tax=Companilactobacillus keshanensis TaxID=2486003 RepID=A0ABW4BTV1_9LACO|nr:GNAT family N-acetyltransferase [Companilactobacillus keshanensis]